MINDVQELIPMIMNPSGLMLKKENVYVQWVIILTKAFMMSMILGHFID